MIEEKKEKLRRKPALMTRISDMGQGRVSVVGTIVRKEEGELTLDDGSAQATVLFLGDIPYTAGNVVRVIGRAYLSTIEAEIISDMSELDLRSYTRILEFKKKLGERGLSP